MYFNTKSYLKNNHYHTAKHTRTHVCFNVTTSTIFRFQTKCVQLSVLCNKLEINLLWIPLSYLIEN